MQPWDRKDFELPGGLPFTRQGMVTWAAANALYRKETFDNYDAQRAILSCVYEGLIVKSIDAGLAIEASYFTKLLIGKQAPPFIVAPVITVTKANVSEGWQTSLHRNPPQSVLDAAK